MCGALVFCTLGGFLAFGLVISEYSLVSNTSAFVLMALHFLDSILFGLFFNFVSHCVLVHPNLTDVIVG